MPSALLIHGVPIECINQAAQYYHVPAPLILSILSVEGGQIGSASPNRNGTFDYGPMQINTIWLDRIKPYGYTREQVQWDPCINVTVGAWILSKSIASSNNVWWGIGGYHSDTPSLNEQYQYKVWNVYDLLSRYLSNPTASMVSSKTSYTLATKS